MSEILWSIQCRNSSEGWWPDDEWLGVPSFFGQSEFDNEKEAVSAFVRMRSEYSSHTLRLIKITIEVIE